MHACLCFMFPACPSATYGIYSISFISNSSLFQFSFHEVMEGLLKPLLLFSSVFNMVLKIQHMSTEHV